jgi:hypothetical protein
MRHMNGWLSLFIVAASNHNRLVAITFREGITEPSADRNDQYKRIEARFRFLMVTPLAEEFRARHPDSVHCDCPVANYEVDELGHYRQLMHRIKAHLEEIVLPMLPSLDFPPMKIASKGQGKRPRLRSGAVQNQSDIDPDADDPEEAGLRVSTTPPAISYKSGEVYLGSAENFPPTPSNIYTSRPSLKEGEEMIPMLDTTWLTLQREKPTMERLNDCVKYIKSLLHSIPHEARSVSLREKTSALSRALNDRLVELEKCLTSRSNRRHILRWLGFLAVVLYRVKSLHCTQGRPSLLSDLIWSMRKLKATGDKEYPTGCRCDWPPSSHKDDTWPFIETLLSHIDHVFAGFKEKRVRYEEAAAAE